MTSYIFVGLLLVLSKTSRAEVQQESNTVQTYGLPELTKDILEKIKAATGQPINTNRFIPILAASTKSYEILEQQPYTKTSKFLKASNNKKLDGGFYHSKKGDDYLGEEKDHFYEVSDKGKKGDDFFKHLYSDESGHGHKFEDKAYNENDFHKEKSGKKGGKSKKGRKRGKFRVEKGFRDIYHKDEEKKSDFFWNNKHEEGKWIQYGLKNRKTEKSHDKGDEGKKVEDKKEESSYEKKENKCTKCKTR